MNLSITPADQRIAAELAEACIHGDSDRLGGLLSDLVDAGTERTLATLAVMGRNLAASLLGSHGRDGALRILEGARLDATLAEPDENGP